MMSCFLLSKLYIYPTAPTIKNRTNSFYSKRKLLAVYEYVVIYYMNNGSYGMLKC